MERIIITGSHGFIGSKLTPYLRGKGYNVIEVNVPLNNLKEAEGSFINADYVIHLAAKVDKVREGRESGDFLEVNVLGTMNIIRLCLKYHCKLIYFSSTLVNYRKNLYGISKGLAEELIKSYVEMHGLMACIIRPCAIYDSNYQDRSGNLVDISKSEWYPMEKLLKLVAEIIENHKFEKKYKIYKTKLLAHKLFFLKRLLNKIYNNVLQKINTKT